MAKLSKFDRWSDKLKKRIEGDVFYHLERNRNTGSTGFFFVPIPMEMESFVESFEGARKFYNRGTSKCIVDGATADEAEKKYIEFCEAYHHANTTMEKVILFRFKYTSRNKTSDPVGKGRTGIWDDSAKKTMEASIEFDWCVADKRTFGKKVTYEAHDTREIKNKHTIQGRDGITPESVKDKTGGNYGTWIEFPYSEDTEAFFTRIYSGMESIMDQFSKFMLTKEQTLLAIKNHQKMLTA